MRLSGGTNASGLAASNTVDLSFSTTSSTFTGCGATITLPADGYTYTVEVLPHTIGLSADLSDNFEADIYGVSDGAPTNPFVASTVMTSKLRQTCAGWARGGMTGNGQVVNYRVRSVNGANASYVDGTVTMVAYREP